MTPEERDIIIDSARYLRNVRPVDPAELATYVSTEVDPETIRSILGDNAVELGLVERTDGMFIPPPEEPLSRSLGTIERFPPTYATILAGLLTTEYGTRWYADESGETLRSTIRRIKEDYYQSRSVDYSLTAAYGYAIYHLPAYYAAAQYILHELIDAGLLSHSINILDVGAGVGGPALGVHDAIYGAPDASNGTEPSVLVSYTAVEPSDATVILDALLAETTRNFHSEIHHSPIEAFEYEAEYDLILFSNVLSELRDPATELHRAEQALATDGSLLAMAPADKNTSIHLRTLERDVTNGLGVFSPTVRLWPDYEPQDRCWSFDVKPDLDIPAFQRDLDAKSGSHHEFVNTDIQYSYVILRHDGERRVSFRPSPDRYMPFASTPEHVTERVTCAAIKLSHDLGDDNPVFLVGDGSQQTDHFCVVARETPRTSPIITAAYGDLLLIERALILWNPDEHAYNLVLDGETTIIHPQ